MRQPTATVRPSVAFVLLGLLVTPHELLDDFAGLLFQWLTAPFAIAIDAATYLAAHPDDAA